MAEAIIKRVLDTVRSNRNVDLISVSGDYGARFICAVLAVDGVPIKVDASCAVTINAKRADGQSKSFEGSVNEDGTVKVPITQWMLEIPHTRDECSVSVVGPDTKLSTIPFDIEIANTPHNSDDISPDDPDYDVLVQVLAGEAVRVAAENARQSAEAIRQSNEDDRSTNEENRQFYENVVRQGNERTRIESENARISAENERKEAENERVAKDEQRDKSVNETLAKLNGAQGIFSNALKGKKSGSIVSIKDISPLEHPLDVRVRGENPTDLSTVKVIKLGKNLTAVNEVQLTGVEIYKSIYEGAIPTTYTLSWKQDFDRTTAAALFAITSSGSPAQYISVGEKAGAYSAQINATPNDAIIRAVNYSKETGRIYDIQIEQGEAATEFEPYIEPVEYAVNADGTVDGVNSIYPATTLLLENEGAVIDVGYNRDINKAFAELYNAIISLGGNV